MIPWDVIKAEYISGVMTGALAKKYNISYSKVRHQIKKNRWVEEKEKFNQSVSDSALEKVREQRVQYYSKNSKDIEEMRKKARSGANSLYAGIMQKLLIKDEDGNVKFDHRLLPQDLSHLSRSMRIAIELMFISYGEPFELVKHSGEIGLGQKTLMDYLTDVDVEHALSQYN